MSASPTNRLLAETRGGSTSSLADIIFGTDKRKRHPLEGVAGPSSEKRYASPQISRRRVSMVALGADRKVYDLDEGKRVFKKGDYSGCVMEMLVCRFGQFFEFESLFPETELYEVSLDVGKTVEKGIAQTKIPGCTLAELLEGHAKPDMLPNWKTVAEALIVAIAFGWSDGHGANIICTPEGELTFVDVPNMFAHGLKFLWTPSGLISPFRCDLLLLSEATQQLNAEKCEWILAVIRKMQERFSAFSEYLQTKEIATYLETLPRGWWDQERVLGVMKERLNRIETSVGTISTLRELTGAVFPYYRVLFGYTLLGKRRNALEALKEDDLEALDRLITDVYSLVGARTVEALLTFCTLGGVNLFGVFEACLEEKISDRALVATLKKHHLPLKKHVEQVRRITEKYTEVLLRDWTAEMPRDLKGVSQINLIEGCFLMLVKALKREGILPVYHQKHPREPSSKKGDGHPYVLVCRNSSPPRIYCYYRKERSLLPLRPLFEPYQVDFLSDPGHILLRKLGSRSEPCTITIELFKKTFRFPHYTTRGKEDAEALLEAVDENSWLLRKGADEGHLFLSYRNRASYFHQELSVVAGFFYDPTTQALFDLSHLENTMAEKGIKAYSDVL